MLLTLVVFLSTFAVAVPQEPASEKSLRSGLRFYQQNINDINADGIFFPFILQEAGLSLQKHCGSATRHAKRLHGFIDLSTEAAKVVSQGLVSMSQNDYSKQFVKLFQTGWTLPNSLWPNFIDHNFLPQPVDPDKTKELDENFEDQCFAELLSEFKCSRGEISQSCWQYNSNKSSEIGWYYISHQLLYMIIAQQKKCLLPLPDADVQRMVKLMTAKMKKMLVTQVKQKLRSSIHSLDFYAEASALGLILGDTQFFDTNMTEFFIERQSEFGCYRAFGPRKTLREEELSHNCLIHATSVALSYITMHRYYELVKPCQPEADPESGLGDTLVLFLVVGTILGFLGLNGTM